MAGSEDIMAQRRSRRRLPVAFLLTAALIAVAQTPAAAPNEVTMTGHIEHVFPSSGEHDEPINEIFLLVRINRTGGTPDSAATMEPYNFKMVAQDGAVYTTSRRHEARENPCSRNIALPTNGFRECRLVFEVPPSVRSGSITWQRAFRSEAAFAFQVPGQKAAAPAPAAVQPEKAAAPTLTYFDKVSERIKSKWVYPRPAGERGIEGEVLIEFHIAKDGRLEFTEVRHSSGTQILDDAALAAVKLAQPFPPVPDDIAKSTLAISGQFRCQIVSGLVQQSLQLENLVSPRAESQGPTEDLDFPYAWYLRKVLARVEVQWERRNQRAEPEKKPLVRVEILRDGTIRPPTIEKSSGDPAYDEAALRAVMEASPFPPLPADWTKPSLRVLISFHLRRG
jgi:TonB family protein